MRRLLENVRIMPKILTMLVLLGAVSVGLVAMESLQMQRETAEYAALVDKKLPATTQMVRMNRYVTEMVQEGYRSLAFPAGAPQARTVPAEIGKSHAAALSALSAAVELDPTLTRPAFDLKGRVDAIHGLALQGTNFALAGEKDAGLRLVVQAEDQLTAFSKVAVALNTSRVEEGSAKSAELSAATASSILLSIVISVVAAGLGVGTSYWVIRTGITRPINALEERMRRLADGDSASEVIGTHRKDEVGAMARALGVFRDSAVKQDKMIRAVTDSAHAIRRGSTEIAQASEDLAKRTESNAASLEETSAAMTEMSQRIKETADSSDRTVARADQTMSTVTGGRGVADEAVQAMGRVSESAKGIDSVIEGLDKIAF